jgi:hypothetical protein
VNRDRAGNHRSENALGDALRCLLAGYFRRQVYANAQPMHGSLQWCESGRAHVTNLTTSVWVVGARTLNFWTGDVP